MDNEHDGWSQYQKLVLKLLEQHEEKLEDLREQCASNDIGRTTISLQVISLLNDVADLSVLLKDGSPGVIPIITKIDHIDQRISNLEETEVSKKKEIENMISHRRALLVASISIFAAVVGELIQKFWIK